MSTTAHADMENAMDASAPRMAQRCRSHVSEALAPPPSDQVVQSGEEEEMWSASRLREGITKLATVSGLTYRTLATGVAKASTASRVAGCKTIHKRPSSEDGGGMLAE